MKRCRVCGERKPPYAFYAHPSSRDGRCKDCHRAVSRKISVNRVFVDGTYRGMSYKLGIPGGNYRGDEIRRLLTPAYRRLDRLYSTGAGGFVYVINNPAWPDWVKVGMTTDAARRGRDYQTGSPFRDYNMVAFEKVVDRRKVEAALLEDLEAYGRREGEWFQLPVPFVVSRLQYFSQV